MAPPYSFTNTTEGCGVTLLITGPLKWVPSGSRLSQGQGLTALSKGHVNDWWGWGNPSFLSKARGSKLLWATRAQSRHGLGKVCEPCSSMHGCGRTCMRSARIWTSISSGSTQLRSPVSPPMLVLTLSLRGVGPEGRGLEEICWEKVQKLEPSLVSKQLLHIQATWPQESHIISLGLTSSSVKWDIPIFLKELL